MKDMYICYTLISEGVARVEAIYNEESIIPEGYQYFYVDALPQEPVEPLGRGMTYVLYANPNTHELWLEAEPRPLTPEEKLEFLMEENELIKGVLDDLLMGGM